MISNASFEIAVDGQPGAPLDWNVGHHAALEETAEFVGDSPLQLAGRETFDSGWSTSGSQAWIAAFTGDQLESLEPERFDAFYPNQGYIYLTALAAFAFNEGTITTETFEFYDVVDSDFELAPTELARAAFDERPAEDFDAGWGAAEFELTGVATAVFGVASTFDENAEPMLYEPFSFRPRFRVRSSIHNNRLVSDTPPLTMSVGDAITFTVEDGGTLPAPLEANRLYVVREFDLVDNAWFTVSPHVNADAIDLTADGFGAVYVVPDPGRFWFDEL